ncbi:histone methyltransferase set2 [Trichoglossum hirsutum]|uniref:Histone-lysine N-methyltransferase, H3 lysine-36 specific n=1 Tax=Trichoglossum hirsutum TaxID=265104 RepID=A0A9P8II66_9PEZI|nr:histone methyltransferase set2 [Trichoglossum hirsutum]
MECVEEECNCGSGCQNQRFQRKQYASVSVIETEKKGFGLRTDSDLNPHDFIYEYVGEVINENQFRRRMIQYDEEGIKHFYFMSLSKGEFVDATRKGNLGRFCNHSCKPNCYVDKWIVGDKLRMGIFAGRRIKAGEELVFNYNVDRYGADPQPCYCGELNCTGYIGGKTQTERATKLSPQTIEALGIDDGDGWDAAVPRRPKKKKQAEDDEEYVNNVEPKALDEKGVTTVMATLVQCKEKWIFVKLLGRIQRCDDERVLNRVVKMHGYQILNPALTTWKEDYNVVLQILDILNKFPRITRNKITDSKIDETVKTLTTCGDEKVQTTATALLKEWSTLEVGYRIPRKKRDENSTSTPDRLDHFQRRESNRDEEKERRKSRSPEPPKGPAAPTGPRNNIPQRNPGYRPAFRPPRPFQHPLPSGWFIAYANGKTYYYNGNGQTTWVRPTMPAYQPPQPKPMSSDQRLQEIIDSITKNTTPKEKAAAAVPQQPANSEAKKEKKKEGHEKWRSLSEEKKKKLYENTVRRRGKSPRDQREKKKKGKN